jgi:hypothetical protein
LTVSEYAIVKDLRDSPEAIKAVQLNAAQAEGIGHKATTTMVQLPLFADEEPESPPPAAKPVKAAAKKPVEVEVATDEPKKVVSKKPAPEPKLADLVGEWDD